MILDPKSDSSGAVCLKFSNGDREVSIAMGDSRRASHVCSRGEIALSRGGMYVTEEVFPGPYGHVRREPTVDDLRRALDWLETV